MSEEVPLCVHWVDLYLSRNIEGKKIFKDQCTKCYNDAVNNIIFIIIIF